MSWLAFAALVAATAGTGRLLRRAPAAGGGAVDPLWSWGLDLLAGIVALHLAQVALDLAGVAWSRATVALALAALAAAGAAGVSWRRRRAAATERPAPSRAPFRFGWGDAVALAVLAVFALLAWRLRIATPDFVYHWGLKAHRYFLAGGIDWAYLTDPLHLTDHPDYPNLLPDLYAATATAVGRFGERTMMAWSVAAFALLLAAAREAWARTATAGAARQAGMAALALGVGMFAVGYQMAGGADWWIALALVAALPPLLAPGAAGTAAGAADDLAVGIAAALAAGVKIEGVPLALFLVGVHLGRRALAGRRLAPAALLRAAGPPLLVVLPWLAENLQRGLFQPNDAGPLDLGHAGVVFAAVGEALATREWHGLAWGVLLVPLLALARPTRPLGIVVALQAALYLFIYLTAPIDPRLYVLSSLPRLLFHLLPAVVVGAVILVAAAAERGRRGDEDR